jgi:fucose permease
LGKAAGTIYFDVTESETAGYFSYQQFSSIKPMSDEIITRHPKRLVTRDFVLPFILVTSLFFLWGVAHSLLDVLNKHFQDILGIT